MVNNSIDENLVIPDDQGDDDFTMAQLLEESGGLDAKNFKRGELTEGIVISFSKEGLVIDLAGKSEGIVRSEEMHSIGPNPENTINIGDTIKVVVTHPETPDGQIGLSIDKAKGEEGWGILQEFFENEENIEATITSFNKGGLLANIEGVNGFIPISQIVGTKLVGTGSESLSSQIGKKMTIKVIEINKRRNRVILSERAAQQEHRSEFREQVLKDLSEGDILKGSVTAIRPFGVFVDIGGADGLVHHSELSWDRQVIDPATLYNVGDDIEVYVMKIDLESKKVALSTRRAGPELWESMLKELSEGDMVAGLVTKLVPFGAFVRIGGPIEGLVHLSEITATRISHSNQILIEGEIVPVKIVKIESERHRLALSMIGGKKKAEAEGWNFDHLGRIITIPEAIQDKFPQEYQTMIDILKSRIDENENWKENNSESPADESPADESPADESPADESPADESPADESPADESPASQS
jgi:small subunit ribosomal protein S1